MAGGRMKKPDDERIRRNHYDSIPIEWDGRTRGPELPLGLPGIKWSTMTLRWWEVWRNSAQAMLFADTDWEFMLETAFMHNEFWSPRKEQVTGRTGKITRRSVPRSPSELKALGSEIRIRLESMGGSIKARSQQGIKIFSPASEDLEEYRAQQLAQQAAEDLINYADIVRDALDEQGKD